MDAEVECIWVYSQRAPNNIFLPRTKQELFFQKNIEH